ncbi:hypothetical protein CKQ84_15635 [Shewanella sp. WE21]|jgi:glycosyltransferase involved in cell wall biosynthesis|uniref:glycosyltransferase family 4 protein n=1 Tax=Shewanella sp. WE21 TaxID=2029986 RepID=UPI000CF5E8CC|nr:glycosyltransferase family 4 protein [Shewanella sp. WE21]AVI67199.1 hypothetical protein CKQ84_15635 [Shewanella sp. WE21]
MKALFVHDHVFLKYKERFYSNGKLTYDVLKYYLEFCSELTVIGRFKIVHYDPGVQFISDGSKVTVIGLHSPVSLNGLLYYKKTKQFLVGLIRNNDFLIIRQPSELGLFSAHLAKKFKVPYIVEMVASPFDCLWYRGDLLAKLYAPLLHLRVKFSIMHSGHVIYVTNEYLQNKYPTLGSYIGVSDARVDSSNAKVRTIDNKDKLVIGVIANPALSLKGISFLYEAFNKLDSSRFELQIVGGTLESELEILMSKSSSIKQLGFIARQEDLFSWLKKIDVYVQPSLTEGLPRSIIEAMSFGVPAIGSNVGGISEIVHKKCLFKSGDVDEIVNVINTLTGDLSLYTDVSNHSVVVSSFFNKSLDVKKENFFNTFKLDTMK